MKYILAFFILSASALTLAGETVRNTTSKENELFNTFSNERVKTCITNLIKDAVVNTDTFPKYQSITTKTLNVPNTKKKQITFFLEAMLHEDMMHVNGFFTKKTSYFTVDLNSNNEVTNVACKEEIKNGVAKDLSSDELTLLDFISNKFIQGCFKDKNYDAIFAETGKVEDTDSVVIEGDELIVKYYQFKGKSISAPAKNAILGFAIFFDKKTKWPMRFGCKNTED